MVNRRRYETPEIRGQNRLPEVLIEAEMYNLPRNVAGLEVQLGAGSFSSFVTRRSYLSCGEGDVERWQSDRSGSQVSGKAISVQEQGNKHLYSLTLPMENIGPGDTLKVRGMRKSVCRNEAGDSFADGFYPTEEIQIKLFLFRERKPLIGSTTYDRALREVNRVVVGTNKVLVNISQDNSNILDCVIDGIVHVQDRGVKIRLQ